MKTYFDFTNKHALITGAAGSIGKGVAAALVEQGAKVFITDLNGAALEQAVSEIDPTGQCCQGMVADVTKAAQVKNVVETAAKYFEDKFDILVNVAGIVAQNPVEDINEEEWDMVYAVNCKGTFFFIREIVPFMKAQNYGKIVNYSSKSGKTGSALMSHYSSAKAAIIGLTQSLAYELAPSKINVNCVCPGITDNSGVWSHVSSGYVKNLHLPIEDVVKKFTAKVPLARLANVSDVVAATLFLCSDGADYFTGQAINITGGREMH